MALITLRMICWDLFKVIPSDSQADIIANRITTYVSSGKDFNYQAVDIPNLLKSTREETSIKRFYAFDTKDIHKVQVYLRSLVMEYLLAVYGTALPHGKEPVFSSLVEETFEWVS